MRRTHHTVMLVCEGDAEVEYARVIRELYLPRNCGVTMRHRNGHGSEAARILTIALQLAMHREFDAYGILIDTDQN